MKKRIFLFVGIILVLAVINQFSKPRFVEANATDDVVIESECISNEIKVEIKGLVKNPGVYTMEEGDRVVDLINKAGGLLEDADISCINQTKHVRDEMLVIIKDSVEVERITTEIEEESSIIYESNDKTTELIEVCSCEFVEVSQDSNAENNQVTIVSLNDATISELMTLPGIGETKAQAIISYRENQLFSDPSEIVNVSGIGQATYEKIKHLIKK